MLRYPFCLNIILITLLPIRHDTVQYSTVTKLSTEKAENSQVQYYHWCSYYLYRYKIKMVSAVSMFPCHAMTLHVRDGGDRNQSVRLQVTLETLRDNFALIRVLCPYPSHPRFDVRQDKTRQDKTSKQVKWVLTHSAYCPCNWRIYGETTFRWITVPCTFWIMLKISTWLQIVFIYHYYTLSYTNNPAVTNLTRSVKYKHVLNTFRYHDRSPR